MTMTTKPKEKLQQCKSCPWRVDCVPDADIPGYSRELHEGLRDTIRDGLESIPGIGANCSRAMACHYSKEGEEHACAGWIYNQLGPGNNIGVRLAVAAGRLPVPEIDGPQHDTFEETLNPPRSRRRR